MADKAKARTVKLSDEEEQIIMRAAEASGEGLSTFMRRVALEAATNPLSTDKAKMQLLQEVAYYMAAMNEENMDVVIKRINSRGAQICQILSSL